MFSIIIPTYNSAKTITKTLDSIAEQTYKNFEVIIVDGLSKDNTIDIINQYAQKFTLQCISEKDNGIYDAMNKGIEFAKNDWVYFLGSDDYLFSNLVLERIAEKITLSNCDIIYGNAFVQQFNKVLGGEFDNERMCIENICHQTIFYKKSLLNEYGRYNILMKVNADIFLNKILFAEKKIKWKFIHETIAFYASTGFSSAMFDEVYWNQAESFLQRYYKQLVSQKIIYTSLLPFIKYKFSFRSFLVSVKASFALKSISPIKLWFQHPLSIPRLFIKNKLGLNKH